jgi:hypothetical protein
MATGNIFGAGKLCLECPPFFISNSKNAEGRRGFPGRPSDDPLGILNRERPPYVSSGLLNLGWRMEDEYASPSSCPTVALVPSMTHQCDAAFTVALGVLLCRLRNITFGSWFSVFSALTRWLRRFPSRVRTRVTLSPTVAHKKARVKYLCVSGRSRGSCPDKRYTYDSMTCLTRLSRNLSMSSSSPMSKRGPRKRASSFSHPAL